MFRIVTFILNGLGLSDSTNNSDENFKVDCFNWHKDTNENIKKLSQRLIRIRNTPSSDDLPQMYFVISLGHQESFEDAKNRITEVAEKTEDEEFKAWTIKHLTFISSIDLSHTLYRVSYIWNSNRNNLEVPLLNLKNKVKEYEEFLLSAKEMPECQGESYREILDYLKYYWLSIEKSATCPNKMLDTLTFSTKTYFPKVDKSPPKEELSMENPGSITYLYDNETRGWNAELRSVRAEKFVNLESTVNHLIIPVAERINEAYSALCSKAGF